MRRPFNGNYTVTQIFNDSRYRDNYKKFGLLGHNGYDYGTSSGTAILAPHAGKIIETTNDPTGYGNYVKIEDAIQGSVLAHLQSFTVKVGDTVNEGQLVGYSGNTGNSTAPHLHWGYYRLPRNRANGFAGFIDQDPYLKPSTPEPTPPALRADEERALKILREAKVEFNHGNLEGTAAALKGAASRLPTIEKDLKSANDRISKVKAALA